MLRKSVSKYSLVALTVVLGALALSASSALAAGKPSSVSSGASSEVYELGSLHLSGWANPNGAATTAKFEYRVYASIEAFHSTPSQALGSGTTTVSVPSQRVDGLLPNTKYEVRLVATNSYGTTTGSTSTAITSQWQIREPVALPATFVSTEGVPVSIEWVFGLSHVTFNCTEGASGEIDNSKSSEDEYNLAFNKCSMALNGEFACNMPSFQIRLGGNFTDPEEVVGFEFPEGCPKTLFGGHPTFYVGEPFYIEVPVCIGLICHEKPEITLEGKMKYGSYTAKISTKGPWELTGANIGHKFGSQYGS